MRIASPCLPILACLLAARRASSQERVVEYGADMSFPMQHASVSTNYDFLPHNADPSIETPDEYKDMPIQPLGNKQQFYEDYIESCVEHYGSKGKRCLANEHSRTEMSLRQPKSMVNYTSTGYTKIRAPEKVFKLIKEFWEINKDNRSEERWPAGNTYVNHWQSKSHMVSVEDKKLDGGGFILKQAIWGAARHTISEWTGQQVAECSLYGIRVYTEGAVLAPHVDRLPLVSSAIINVDQDVDEPWPLEVIGHDGKAVNVTMEPGDLVLYESHSIIHGRPFPLKGRFMANVFIHFEPVGKVGEEVVIDPELPQYVIRGSEEEPVWKGQNPGGYSVEHAGFMTGSTAAHKAAQMGDASLVRKLLQHDPELLQAKDKNGWQPIHEASRHGHVDAVKALVELGADVNARTKKGQEEGLGGSVLWWAEHYADEDHELVKFLREQGGKSFAPGETSEL